MKVELIESCAKCIRELGRKAEKLEAMIPLADSCSMNTILMVDSTGKRWSSGGLSGIGLRSALRAALKRTMLEITRYKGYIEEVPE